MRHSTGTRRRLRYAALLALSRRGQLVIAATVVVAFVVVAVVSGDFRGGLHHAWRVMMSGNQHEIGAYLRSFGLWGPLISILLMIAQAIIAPIPGALLVFANGIAFGTFWGTVLSVIGQTLAAVVCFWLARLIGRHQVEKLVGRFGLESLDRMVGRWGALGIVVLRMVPGMAFDGVSYGAGLLKMRASTFVAATFIGIIPQSLFYTWMIQHYPKLTWIFMTVAISIFVAVVAAGAVVGIVRRRHGTRGVPIAGQ